MACREGWGVRSLRRRRAAGSLVALRCLGRSRVQGPGGGPERGAPGRRGPLERGESRLLLGWFIVASSALQTQTLRLRLQRLRCPGARCPPCLPRQQDRVSVPKPASTGQTKAGSCCFERW